jgi:hypothetical protein
MSRDRANEAVGKLVTPCVAANGESGELGELISQHDFVSSALRAPHRVYLVDLREKTGPGGFGRIDRDVFTSIRQWLVAEVACDAVALIGG